MAPASSQPMAAVEKDRCEHDGADRVAEQQGEQTGQRRSLRAQAHPPPHPPAQPPSSRLFGQHREARRHSHPADIDQRAERRTVAVERAPLPNQRPGRVRQHADVGHRLALQAHREMAERADGTHIHGRRGRRARRRITGGRQRRVGCASPRRDRQQKQKNHEQGRTGPENPSARAERQPQPHAAGLPRNRRRLCLLASSPQAAGGCPGANPLR